ncbi:MAG: transposase [Gammaproteobacteria bacterium]|nr:transposase [Gammaproteobacteria bacterium]
MKDHRPLTPRQERETQRTLFKAILTLQDTDECRRFFLDLCSPAELQALADRWSVVRHLEQDLPYRQIHDLTGVSVTTIGRVARCLNDGNGGYKIASERLD